MADIKVASCLSFKEPVKHGKMQFVPGPVYGFEDVDAAPYFTALDWAEASKAEPTIIVTIGEIDIDPQTVFGSGDRRGQKVLEG